MKKRMVFTLVMILSINCMIVPVSASEKEVVVLTQEARLNYSPYCPDCGILGTYIYQETTILGTKVYRECPKCELLYGHYS